MCVTSAPARAAPALPPPRADRPPGLANATIHQRLTVLRLFYDYLCEEGLCAESPLPRGRWTSTTGFGGARVRALIPRYQTLPWIPTDAQWQTFIALARTEPIRTRCMLAFAYDAALRREELCALTVADVDPAQRLLRIRAETTKNHRERIVPYSAATSTLYATYLQQRRTLSQARGPLFLSESRRNHAQPLAIWTWSKVVQALAQRADLPAISTHTFRHLCLTDLARAGWELHAIATFAGHRSLASTMRYIHLSGRELADRLARTTASLHASRVQPLLEVQP